MLHIAIGKNAAPQSNAAQKVQGRGRTKRSGWWFYYVSILFLCCAFWWHLVLECSTTEENATASCAQAGQKGVTAELQFLLLDVSTFCLISFWFNFIESWKSAPWVQKCRATMQCSTKSASASCSQDKEEWQASCSFPGANISWNIDPWFKRRTKRARNNRRGCCKTNWACKAQTMH